MRKARVEKGPKAQKVASHLRETSTCADTIFSGIGHDEYHFQKMQTVSSEIVLCLTKSLRRLPAAARFWQILVPRRPSGPPRPCRLPVASWPTLPEAPPCLTNVHFVCLIHILHAQCTFLYTKYTFYLHQIYTFLKSAFLEKKHSNNVVLHTQIW